LVVKIAADQGDNDWAGFRSYDHITRNEPFPFIYENADFSLDAIKSSITDGELKTNQILQKQSS